MLTLTSVVVVLAAVLVGRLAARSFAGERAHAATGATSVLSGRAAVWVAGCLAGAVVWWVWGHWSPTPTVHDEASYLFQARTFARLRLANPAPPIPEFFEQFHVFVTPTFASKYPPGAALLMVPGIWLGITGLMPMAMIGVAGATLFALTRRVAGPWTALLAWLVWLSAPATLSHGASYFSENTTQALWLVGWWCMLQWRDRGGRWLVGVSACVGWMAITRPLTAVAFALPAAVWIVWRIARRGAWSEVGLPAVVVCAIVAILPLTTLAVTGHARPMAWTVYSQDYFPFDRIGFGYDSTPPRRALPPDMRTFTTFFVPAYREHVVSALPDIAARRGIWVLADMYQGNRLLLLPLAVLGLVVGGGPVGFAAVSAAVLFASYLLYAHYLNWTLYYVELQPVLAALAALGLARALAWATGESARQAGVGVVASVLTVVAMTLPTVSGVVARERERMAADMRPLRDFFARIDAIPEPKAIVFVRYAPNHAVHRSLIANEPLLADAHVWLVYDRGEDNQRLRAAAPDRVAYVFDEATGRLSR